MAAQEKRAQRVQAVRRRKGVPKNFAVGDAVLMLPPKRGRVSRPLGPKRVVCRVISQQRYGGMTKYKVRCNAGIIAGYQFVAALDKAPAEAAAKLRFDGVGVEGVPEVSYDTALAAKAGSIASIKCRCNGKCTSRCSCKKAGVLCSRACGCPACKGINCGNH